MLKLTSQNVLNCITKIWVDLADQLIALYRISFRVRKYYHKLVFHLLDMSIANAWLLLYRRDAKKLLLSINKLQSVLQFKISIVDSLLKVGKCDYKKRGRKSDNEENFQKKKKRQMQLIQFHKKIFDWTTLVICQQLVTIENCVNCLVAKEK